MNVPIRLLLAVFLLLVAARSALALDLQRVKGLMDGGDVYAGLPIRPSPAGSDANSVLFQGTEYRRPGAAEGSNLQVQIKSYPGTHLDNNAIHAMLASKHTGLNEFDIQPFQGNTLRVRYEFCMVTNCLVRDYFVTDLGEGLALVLQDYNAKTVEQSNIDWSEVAPVLAQNFTRAVNSNWRHEDDGSTESPPADETLTEEEDGRLPDTSRYSGGEDSARFDQASIAAIGVSGVMAGGLAGLGAWLMLGQAGVGRREALDAMGDLLRGRLPPDGFDEWKARYEAIGWIYREENGVARFELPSGYQAQPTPVAVTEHHGGDVNEETGEVWSEEDGGWVSRNLYEQEQARATEIAEIEQRNRAAVAVWDADTRRLDAAIAASAQDRAAREAAEEAKRIRIGDKLTRLLEEKGMSTEEVERLRRERDTVELEDWYERMLHERMAESAANAAYWDRWAKIHGAGALASKAVLAGAKAGMLVVTGPAGYIPAAIGSGILRSADDGANAYVMSDGNKAELGKALVSGFFAGVKDGVVGRFTSLPRTGTVTKVLLPAATDAGETYVRTGDIKAAVSTAVLSAAGGATGARMDTVNSVLWREGGQLATGTLLGATGSWINGGSFSEGAVNGLVESLGGRVGQHLGSTNLPMIREEILMDLEYKAKLADARDRIDTLKAALASGDESAVKNALHDVLNHREAKLLIGDKGVDPDLQKTYAELTQQHRTQPVFDSTADALNNKTFIAADGTEQPRFVIRDDNGTEHPIMGNDFASGSGSAESGKPGIDLDMYPKGTIIDRATGRPAKLADVNSAVHEGCTKLGIDPHQQEINVTGMKGPEDWTMQPGETPQQFIERVQATRKASGMEGQGITEVTTSKLREAMERHGGGAGSSAVAENARTVMKDHGRLIKSLLAGDHASQLPEVFRRQHAVTGETPLSILQKVADGRMTPGTGNAMFKQLTGMSITEASPKLASFGESLGKWNTGPAAMEPIVPPTPSMTGSGAGVNIQQVIADSVRDAAGKKEGG